MSATRAWVLAAVGVLAVVLCAVMFGSQVVWLGVVRDSLPGFGASGVAERPPPPGESTLPRAAATPAADNEGAPNLERRTERPPAPEGTAARDTGKIFQYEENGVTHLVSPSDGDVDSLVSPRPETGLPQPGTGARSGGGIPGAGSAGLVGDANGETARAARGTDTGGAVGTAAAGTAQTDASALPPRVAPGLAAPDATGAPPPGPAASAAPPGSAGGPVAGVAPPGAAGGPVAGDTTTSAAGPACGTGTCAAGQECCNDSCGICTAPGGQCFRGLCGVPWEPVSATCGMNTCNVDQVCCNWSCGICTAPGAPCSQEQCDNAPTAPLSVSCGMNTCNVGEICCNPTCGICTAPEEGCTHEICTGITTSF